jgi:uncharacterized protein (DUF2235 family)
MSEMKTEIFQNHPNRTPRHLMLFLDGTWNDETGYKNNGIVTNIFKLFKTIEGEYYRNEVPLRIEGQDQIALYFRGIGNDEENNIFERFYKGAFGAGEKQIRDHIFVQIVKHFCPGDRISIFGFSRGAACARLLAAKIHKHGIPKNITVKYREVENKNTGNLEPEFIRYEEMNSSRSTHQNIHFLGLFDTVGAFGIPLDIGPFGFQKINLFKNLTVADCVEKTVHCVSIDDSRDAFKPTLCNYKPTVDEVWFAGTHSDVGGGYRNSELGKISMNYMLRTFQEHSHYFPVKLNHSLYKEHAEYDLDNRNILIHYHGDGLKTSPRKIQVQENEQPTRQYAPKIHGSVFHLMNRKNIFWAEKFNSIIVPKQAIYAPTNIFSLSTQYEVID